VAPSAHTTETPSDLDLNNGTAITLGVRFVVSTERTIPGVAFYVPATNTGTYTAEMWQTTSDDDPNGSGTGTLLASKAATAASLSIVDGWASIMFDTPPTAATDEVYTVAVNTSSGRFVRTSNVFGTTSIVGNGVTLLQAGTDPNPPGLGSMINGQFVESAAGSYPNSAFNFADYFIDVALAVEEAIEADLAATLPAFSVAGAASASATAGLAATLPAFTVAGAGAGSSAAAFAATVPAFAFEGVASVPVEGDLGVTLPAFSAAFVASATGVEARIPFAGLRRGGKRGLDTLRPTPTFRPRRR
jgi:hypothetical protein